MRCRPAPPPGCAYEIVGGERKESMKTSLGIWAFGSMATRFVPGGYKPEWAARTPSRACGAPSRASAT